jgi:hypothetical protein
MSWLACDSAADHLLVADLAGECGLLGAYQRVGRTGESSELRGPCGGRSVFAGEGVTVLFAVARDLGAWLGEEAAGLSGPRILNRLVRGVLAGLARLRVEASYPGRDFVVGGGARIAQLAVTRGADGSHCFQAAFGRTRSHSTREPEPEFPGLPPSPPADVLGVEAEALVDALAGGFESRFGLELVRAQLSRSEVEQIEVTRLPALADPELAGLRAAEPVATPIGELLAHVALRADGALERVRLRGDFMAAPGDLRALEESLVGAEPGSPRVRELCARWLAAPAHLVVGVTDPGALAEAIARAGASHSRT